MTLRLPLAKNRSATFVSVYSPTLDSSDDVKDRFYDTLYSTLRRISQNDKIILLGDFNARVGRNNEIWHGVIGHHGVGNVNSSGLRLLSVCSELGLAITNTFFQLRDMHKTSWLHPRSKHWHLIDYVIVMRRDLNEVQITRAMRGAECSTDHLLIRSTLRLLFDHLLADRSQGINSMCMRPTTKTSERNCAMPLTNLCPTYQRLLH